MIIKVKILDSAIVSATLFLTEDRTDGTPLEHTETELHVSRQWSVQLTASELRCESVRHGQDHSINVVTYKVSYSGLAEQRLSDGISCKVIKTERVFRRPGNFNGTLSLIYNANGHRFASFLSEEYLEFLAERHLDWVVQKAPKNFSLEMKGKYQSCLFGQTEEGFAVCNAELREIYTDGALGVCVSDGCARIRIAGGTWVVLVKHHIETQKTERILLTKLNFTYLDGLPSF